VPHWIYDDEAVWNHTVIDAPAESTFNVIYGYRCNYTCEGCCVGSNHVKDTAQDPDLEVTMAAIDRLPGIINIRDSDDYWQRGMITLLGGEPMMYWSDRIVPLARRIRQNFPRARLNIFSNGHLLHKHGREVIDLMDELNANITISRHFVGDMNSAMGQRWQHNIQEFLSDPRVVKIHDDHYHIKNNWQANIHFHVGDNWYTWYRIDTAQRIKPHATGRPDLSIQHGCASGRHCSSLYENRLYKCSSLAMLPGLLSALGQSHDPDWRAYTTYPFVDVFDVDPERLQNYRDTYGRPISQCDMCNDKPRDVVTWYQRRQDSILPVPA
jgi:organic radical activating enzyme